MNKVLWWLTGGVAAVILGVSAVGSSSSSQSASVIQSTSEIVHTKEAAIPAAKDVSVKNVESVNKIDKKTSPKTTVEEKSAKTISEPVIVSTPAPTSVQTKTQTSALEPVPIPVPEESTLSNDNHYTNVSGDTVHSPAYSSDNSVPSGASAQCRDGSYSFSQHRSGTCSHHGGVASWL